MPPKSVWKVLPLRRKADPANTLQGMGVLHPIPDEYPTIMSRTAVFRFYEELNDFLPVRKQKQEISLEFEGSPSVKDAIECLGVPHTEVDMILVNGEAVGFSHLLSGNERIAVYPCFESLDISGVTGLRPRGLRQTRFILDVHLGKLARYLRLVGFDSVYEKDYDDREIARRSVSEKRILLTRDVGLLKYKDITHGYWLRSQQALIQLREVLERFDLYSSLCPFSRCMECNSLIEKISREEALEYIPPKTRTYFTDFYRCSGCRKIYWEGSHYDRMKHLVEEIRQTGNNHKHQD